MKTLLLFLSLIVATSQAATVRLYFTDPLTNDKDTNAFYITPIGTNVLSSGGVVGRGVTTRYVPASNGYRTNTLAVGHYSITNRSLGSGVVIRVPDSSSLYDYTNILISGYNIFVTITNGDSGTSGALTNNDTRAVTLTNLYNPKIRIVGVGDYVDFLTNESGAFSLATDNVTQPGLHVRNADLYAENIYATAGIFSGSGAGLTSVHGSNSISAGTISTNKMDATAYAAFVGGGTTYTNNTGLPGVVLGSGIGTNLSTLATQAGLAAGSVVVDGILPSQFLPQRNPSIGFDSWPVFTTEWGVTTVNQYGTNSQRWLTNLINLLRDNPSLRRNGADTIWVTDGWQDTARDGGGNLTWNPLVFTVGMQTIISNAHQAGLKIFTYTSSATNTCRALPGSPTNTIYADVIAFMEAGYDGMMVDTCNTGVSQDENYNKVYTHLLQKAISDFHTERFQTNGLVRPFFVHWTTGNGPGTLPQILNANSTDAYQAIGISAGFTDANHDVPLGNAAKGSLLVAKDWIGPGRSPMFTFFYTASHHAGMTNIINTGMMINGMLRLSIGDRIGEWVPGGTDLGGYGPGPSYTEFTNLIAPILNNDELMRLYNNPPYQTAATIVRTNGTVEIWQKPIGSPTTPTANVLYLLNTAATSSGFVVNVNDFNGTSNTTYTLRNPWNNSDITDFINTVSVTVAATNSDIYSVSKAKPMQIVSGRDLTGTGGGFSIPTAAAVGPTPFFNVDGVSTTAGNVLTYFYIPVPPGTRKTTLVYRFYSAFAGTVAWTNTPGVDYYTAVGRVQATSGTDAAITNHHIEVTSGNAVWHTNVIGTTSNSGTNLCVVSLSMSAGSNASARYIIGPILMRTE